MQIDPSPVKRLLIFPIGNVCVYFIYNSKLHEVLALKNISEAYKILVNYFKKMNDNFVNVNCHQKLRYFYFAISMHFRP